ncbi:MAG: hypothetical protein H6Q72_4487 [Firmicutes bacterium]|nr:hypothetical protein [Bacillota bacterium]
MNDNLLMGFFLALFFMGIGVNTVQAQIKTENVQ